MIPNTNLPEIYKDGEEEEMVTGVYMTDLQIHKVYLTRKTKKLRAGWGE